MKLKTYISLLTLLFVFTITFSQDLVFEIKPDRTKIGINEALEVDFIVNKDVDSFIAPDFNDFKILRGPSLSVDNKWVSGNKIYSKTYKYSLLPQRKGTIEIDEAVVNFEEKNFRTKSLTIEVTDAVVTPIDALEESFLNNVHVVAEVDNVNSRLGDQITVIFKLYVSQDVGISNWEEIHDPEYIGFESENVNLEIKKVENGKFKGESYRYVIWRKTLLKPTQVGTFELRPTKLNITAEIPTNTRDVFGGRLMESVTKTIQTEPIII